MPQPRSRWLNLLLGQTPSVDFLLLGKPRAQWDKLKVAGGAGVEKPPAARLPTGLGLEGD